MIMMMIQHWLPIVRLSSEASIKMDGDTSSTFILELVVTKDTKLCPKSTFSNRENSSMVLPKLKYKDQS